MDGLCCNHLQVFWALLIDAVGDWVIGTFHFRAAVIPGRLPSDWNDLSEPSPLSSLTWSSVTFPFLHLSLLFPHTLWTLCVCA